MLERYQLVQLKNGTFSIRSLEAEETFHPVIGPRAEADALYVKQLALVDRLARAEGEFVVWDVGLGAAGNPLCLISAAAHLPKQLKIVSFDHTREALRFALRHPAELGYFDRYVPSLEMLCSGDRTSFVCLGGLSVDWELHVADFPSFLRSSAMQSLPKPHAIFFDAFSPQKNAAMWNLPLFRDLYRLLDPGRPCAMPTYSRSTLLRVTLLLAGFFVGVGHATGEKEETTIAANSAGLIGQPLDAKWLARARRSRSAEPLLSAEYRQAPLASETLDRLLDHPQFR